MFLKNHRESSVLVIRSGTLSDYTKGMNVKMYLKSYGIFTLVCYPSVNPDQKKCKL